MKNQCFKIMIILFIISLKTIDVYASDHADELIFTVEETEYIKSDQTVFIAGNPNLFPIEYYSADEDKFCGIIPEYFKIISNLSGIKFEYIDEHGLDLRLNLGKNKQVEILSAFEYDRYTAIKHNLKTGSTILINPKTGDKIRLAYTSIAPEPLQSIVKKCYDAISSKEKEAIYIKSGMEYFNKSVALKIIAFVSSALCILLAGGIFILIRRVKIDKNKIIEYLNTDEYLGCSNYNNFKSSYEKYVPVVGRVNYHIVTMDIGIDKIIDVYGFKEATDLLKSTIQLISKCLDENEHECLCTTEGKIFLMLLKNQSSDMLQERLRKMHESIMSFVQNCENSYNLNISIGVFRLRQIDDTLENAIYNSMQARKHAFENEIFSCIFNEVIGKQIFENSQLEKDLINGLLTNEFTVFLQPVFNLDDEKMQGCEGLVRWENERRGLLRPGAFLPALEKMNMIDKLDLLMFENICKLLENRKKQGKKLFWISCNFSRKNFMNPDFAKNLLRIALIHGIAPSYLLIEVTEGLDIDKKNSNDKIINQLNSYGFPLVIDNFGSNYSSFTSLSEYPIKFVKLDKKLIDGIESEKMSVIIDGLSNIMRNLNIKIMCSGIENENQARQVEKMEFDCVQGNFFYYAMQSDELEKLYDAQELNVKLE